MKFLYFLATVIFFWHRILSKLNDQILYNMHELYQFNHVLVLINLQYLMVLAAYSCLSLVIQTGTILWASTWWIGVSICSCILSNHALWYLNIYQVKRDSQRNFKQTSAQRWQCPIYNGTQICFIKYECKIHVYCLFLKKSNLRIFCL